MPPSQRNPDVPRRSRTDHPHRARQGSRSAIPDRRRHARRPHAVPARSPARGGAGHGTRLRSAESCGRGRRRWCGRCRRRNDAEPGRSRRRTSTRVHRREPPEKSSRRALIVALIVLGLVIIVGLIVAFASLAGDGGQVTVPDVRQQPVAEARRELEERGLKVVEERANSGEVPVDVVIDQDPAPDAEVDEGSEVTLTVSVGVEQITVEDVVGATFDEARERLEDQGFKVERHEEASAAVESGRVVRTEPAGGAPAAEGLHHRRRRVDRARRGRGPQRHERDRRRRLQPAVGGRLRGRHRRNVEYERRRGPGHPHRPRRRRARPHAVRPCRCSSRLVTRASQVPQVIGLSEADARSALEQPRAHGEHDHPGRRGQRRQGDRADPARRRERRLGEQRHAHDRGRPRSHDDHDDHNRSARRLSVRLADWYDRAGRHELPWRATRDRWAVLVSELMLQQTQVPRVLSAWPEFMARFPDVATAAAAGPAALIDAWASGYANRASPRGRACRQAGGCRGPCARTASRRRRTGPGSGSRPSGSSHSGMPGLGIQSQCSRARCLGCLRCLRC